MSFEFLGKKISENQFVRLLDKGSTVNLKGFKTPQGKADGTVVFNSSFKLELKPKEIPKKEIPEVLTCPKCKKGTILKGSTAYGCSDYKLGCDFKMSFSTIKEKAKDQKLTKDLVFQILNS